MELPSAPLKVLACAAISVLLLELLFPAPAAAQLAGATLSGVVSDSSGAVVPNAKVSVKNMANGDVREVLTNSDGVYSAPNLLPGTYSVTATAPQFSTVVQKGLTLTVGAEQALNFTLKVGQHAETVEVDDAPPAVETTSSTLSATVLQTTVVELPLNGRDWTQLATLQPGVISVRAQASTGSTANRGNRGFGDQLADSGHRPNENTYRIDGISINDYSNGAPGSVLGASLGVDAVQEFNVVTTNYSADYGRTSGAVINAITKSGTNTPHGSGYFFDRDRIFDARNYFDASGHPVPPFRRTQFGGSAGGPIIKDKTFIFGDYEGVRQSQTLTFGKQLVPSAATRSGILCSAPDPGSSCSPTNVGVDPQVQPFLALWPNGNGGIVPGTNGDVEFLNTGGLKILNENYFTVRADHKISGKDSLNATYFFDTAPQTQPDSLDNVIHQVFTRRQMFGLTENHIINTNLVNTFRLGFSRVVGLVNQPVKAINPAGSDPALGTIPGQFAALINVSGLTGAGGLGDISFFGHHWNSYQANDDLSLTHGKHSLTFGFAFERMQYDVLSKVRGNGNFTFGPLNGISGIEAFLTNQPTKVLLLSPTIRKEVGSRDSLFGGYIQDDWRVRPRFTLNLGLRYEMLTLPTEAHDGFGVLQNFFTSTGTTPVKHMWQSNPTLKNFDPRIGFSWDPTGNGKTAIRAGFGMFDVLPLPYVYTIGDSLTLPFSLQTGLGSASSPLPQGSFPRNLPAAAFNLANAGSRFVDQHPPRSYAMNWNANIQRELTRNVTATVGYVGSHTIHEPFTTDDSNQVIPTLVNGVFTWPTPVGSGTLANPNVGFIRPIFFDGSSSYEGFQTQVQMRMMHGVQAQAAYTYGKCYDDGSGAQLGDPFLNSLASLIFFDHQHRHGPCDFDIRHNFSLNYIWDVPTPQWGSAAKWVLGGWQIGGIVTASSGVPFTLILSGDPLGQNSTDAGYDYPDRATGCSPINSNFKSNGLQYVNTSCFSIPATPVLGNNGRNSLYGPRLVNVDFSVFKNNRIGERLNLQFRAEFFNILNHANFQAPVDNFVLGVGGAGVIDSTTTPSRQIQLGMKIVF